VTEFLLKFTLTLEVAGATIAILADIIVIHSFIHSLRRFI